MFRIEGVDFELPQMGKEPQMGYEDEYDEHTMMSGRIVRVYKGRRFRASVSYGFLNESQIATLYNLLDVQRLKGFLIVQIDNQRGRFNGDAIVSLNNNQKRFSIDRNTGIGTWINWELNITGVRYD